MSELDLENAEVQKIIQQKAQEIADKNLEDKHAGLLSKRDELLANNRELKDKLSKFEGLDPEAARSAMTTAEKLEEERLRKEGEFDALLQKQATKFEEERGTAKQREEKLLGALKQSRIHEAATSAIAKERGIPELLMPHIAPRMALDENFNVQVLDRDGTPLLNGKNQPATVQDLVAELKQDPLYGRAFEVTPARGTGATGSSGGYGSDLAGNPFAKDEKTGKMANLTEAMRITKQDPQQAAKLATAAGTKIPGLND